VTHDQVRARLFPFSLHGKALCWFHTLPVESKQDWEALMRNFMMELHELDEYILSDDDHRRRVAERNEARQGNREMTWKAPP
jgi:hypothetical protein